MNTLTWSKALQISTLVSTLFSAVSFAAVGVGDRAVYQVNTVKHGKPFVFMQSKEVTQMDLPNQRYLLTWTDTYANKKTFTTHAFGYLQTVADFDRQVSPCEGSQFVRPVNGTKASVTVPAGTFTDACYFEYTLSDGTQIQEYLSNVPFHILAQSVTAKNGEKRVLNLTQYQGGNYHAPVAPETKAAAVEEENPYAPTNRSLIFVN